MDPCMGKWLRESSSMELANCHNANMLKLKDVAKILQIPTTPDVGRLHTAGFDAKLHAKVYRALVAKSKEAQAPADAAAGTN